MKKINLASKSKSIGQTLRVTGVVCLMREALLAMRDENYAFNHMITGGDFDMGSNIVEHSVKTSFPLPYHYSMD